MKITIDEKVCTKYKLLLPEFLMALAVKYGIDGNLIQNMLSREILVETQDNGWFMVTQRWSDILDEIICDSQGVEKSDDELLELAKKMREVYPRGKMKDRFGRDTPYFYRCNNAEIVKKLKKFFIEAGYYTDDEIIDATKRYVADFHGDYNGRLRLIKYFIWKDDVKPSGDGQGHVEPVSDLLTYLSNQESEGGVEVTNSDEWLMNSRN